jgi:hypothetical protein
MVKPKNISASKRDFAIELQIPGHEPPQNSFSTLVEKALRKS